MSGALTSQGYNSDEMIDNPAIPADATRCPTQLAYQRTKGLYVVSNVMPSPESCLKQYQVFNTTAPEASRTLSVKNITNYVKLVTALDSSLFGAFSVPTPMGIFPKYASSTADVAMRIRFGQ